MITEHQYIDRYPITPNSNLLILGTIHPHDINSFQLPYFYGNRNTIWNLLSDAFPKELLKPITLNSVLTFLDNRKIAVSDTIRKCERINPTALDKDLITRVLHENLLDQIKNSNIESVLCTSGFGKNNAFRLFYESLLGLKITPEILQARQTLLDPTVFGRPVLVKALYSPSASSNIALSKNANYLIAIEKYAHSTRPVYDFKVEYYRRQFSKL